MNKKAQLNTLQEVAGGFVALFAFSLIAIIISLVLINFNTIASEQSVFQTSALSGTMTKMLEYPVFMDWGALILFGITLIASLWILYSIEAESMLYLVAWISFIALSVAIIGAGYALEQFVNSPLTASATANMIFIPFYASNAFMFALIYFFSCAIALHAPKQ